MRPILLQGHTVRLEPLALEHAEDLFRAGRDASIWRYMPRTPIASAEDAREMIRDVLATVRTGVQVAFAIVEKESGRAVGSTRYIDIRPEHKGLEIGWTWIGVAHQRTAANTECKRMLLGHAFEKLGMMRVQLKTDARNVQSQKAIERIGAVREGVLRAHMIMPDGFVRDSVMYSIVASEWPEVRTKLEAMEARYAAR